MTMSPPEYIANHWVHSNQAGFFKKQVAARAGYLALAPVSAILAGTITVIGTGACLAAIASLGKHIPTYKFARQSISASRYIIATPYANLLNTFNPEADFSTNEDGFLAHFVTEYLRGIARRCYQSDDFFKCRIASRATYALLAVTAVITRLADAIIGVVAAAASFAALGKITSINKLAFKSLQAPGIVKDLFYCAGKLINPENPKSSI